MEQNKCFFPATSSYQIAQKRRHSHRHHLRCWTSGGGTKSIASSGTTSGGGAKSITSGGGVLAGDQEGSTSIGISSGISGSVVSDISLSTQSNDGNR